MRPSEVREQVLADHSVLRRMLESLEDLARQVRLGERALLGPLRCEGEALLSRLREHMKWEDRYLSAALRDADDWGEERAERLAADHREQRELLGFAVERLRDQTRPPVMIARDLENLVTLLREDMEDEEATLLDERVLRDDVIAIDAETG